MISYERWSNYTFHNPRFWLIHGWSSLGPRLAWRPRRTNTWFSPATAILRSGPLRPTSVACPTWTPLRGSEALGVEKRRALCHGYIYICIYICIYIYTVHIYMWQSSQDWLIPNLLIGERTNLKSNLWLFLGVTPPIDSQDSFIQGGHYTCNNIHLYKMNNTEHAPTRKGMRKLPRTADIRFLQRRTAVSKNDL